MPTPSHQGPGSEYRKISSASSANLQNNADVDFIRHVASQFPVSAAGRRTRDGHIITTVFVPTTSIDRVNHGQQSIEVLRALIDSSRGARTNAFRISRMYEEMFRNPHEVKTIGYACLDISKVEGSTSNRPQTPLKTGPISYKESRFQVASQRAEKVFHGFVGAQNGIGFSAVETYASNSEGPQAALDRLNLAIAQRYDHSARQKKTAVGDPILVNAVSLAEQRSASPRATQWILTQENPIAAGAHASQQLPLLPRGSSYKSLLNEFDKYGDPAEVGIKYIHEQGSTPKVRGYMVVQYTGEPPFAEEADPGPADGTRALTRHEQLENAARKFTNALNRFPHRKPITTGDGRVVGVNVVEFSDYVLAETTSGVKRVSDYPIIPCWLCVVHFEDTNPDVVARVKQDENALGMQLIMAKQDGEDGRYFKGEFKFSEFPRDYKIRGDRGKQDLLEARAADDGVVASDGRYCAIRTFHPVRRCGINALLTNWEFVKFLTNHHVRNKDNIEGDSSLHYTPNSIYYGTESTSPPASRFIYACTGVDRAVKSGIKKPPAAYQIVNSTSSLSSILKRTFSLAEVANAERNKDSSLLYKVDNNGLFPALFLSSHLWKFSDQENAFAMLRREGDPAAKGLFRQENGVGFFINDRAYAFDRNASYHTQTFMSCCDQKNWFEQQPSKEIVGAGFLIDHSPVGQFINGAETSFRYRSYRLGFVGKVVESNLKALPKLPRLDQFEGGDAGLNSEIKTNQASATSVSNSAPSYVPPQQKVTMNPREAEAQMRQWANRDPFVQLGLNYEDTKKSIEPNRLISEAYFLQRRLLEEVNLPKEQNSKMVTTLQKARDKAEGIANSKAKQLFRRFFQLQGHGPATIVQPTGNSNPQRGTSQIVMPVAIPLRQETIDKLMRDLSSRDPFVQLGIDYDAAARSNTPVSETVSKAYYQQRRLLEKITLEPNQEVKLGERLLSARRKAESILNSPIKGLIRRLLH